MSHKVDAPNIEDFNFKDEVEGHLILPGWIPHSLAAITCADICMDILEEGGPKEPRLEQLSGCLGGASMSSTRRVVTMGDNTMDFSLRKASPANRILTQLVKEGLLSKIHLDIIEEFLFLVGG